MGLTGTNAPRWAGFDSCAGHTEIVGQILRDLWPLIAGAFSVLGVALHQFIALLR